MNPHQKNKIDINALSPEEQRLFRLYGKVPSRGDLLQNKLKERKYFDSGDYALSKAGKASDVGVTSIGSQHPLPENIPHLSSPGPQAVAGTGPAGTANAGGNAMAGGLTTPAQNTGPSTSPREGTFLQKSVSAEDQDQDQQRDGFTSPGKEVPVRWQS